MLLMSVKGPRTFLPGARTSLQHTYVGSFPQAQSVRTYSVLYGAICTEYLGRELEASTSGFTQHRYLNQPGRVQGSVLQFLESQTRSEVDVRQDHD